MRTIFLVCIILLTSCDSKVKNPSIQPDIKDPGNAKKQNANIKTNKLNEAQKNYEKIFIASNDSYYQELSVNWISEDRIEYKLVFDNELCEMSCTGKAVNQNKGTPFETDKYKGHDYTSIQYEDKKDGSTIILRIDAFDKDKAKADIITEEGDCSPYEYIMTEKK